MELSEEVCELAGKKEYSKEKRAVQSEISIEK